MSLLRVESHEISGGVDAPRHIRIVLKTGAGQLMREGTYPYPDHLSGIDAHESCITQLIDRETYNRIESFYSVGETATGYKWTVFLRNE